MELEQPNIRLSITAYKKGAESEPEQLRFLDPESLGINGPEKALIPQGTETQDYDFTTVKQMVEDTQKMLQDNLDPDAGDDFFYCVKAEAMDGVGTFGLMGGIPPHKVYSQTTDHKGEIIRDQIDIANKFLETTTWERNEFNRLQNSFKHMAVFDAIKKDKIPSLRIDDEMQPHYLVEVTKDNHALIEKAMPGIEVGEVASFKQNRSRADYTVPLEQKYRQESLVQRRDRNLGVAIAEKILYDDAVPETTPLTKDDLKMLAHIKTLEIQDFDYDGTSFTYKGEETYTPIIQEKEGRRMYTLGNIIKHAQNKQMANWNRERPVSSTNSEYTSKMQKELMSLFVTNNCLYSSTLPHFAKLTGFDVETSEPKIESKISDPMFSKNENYDSPVTPGLKV